MKRKAKAYWSGSLKEGKGILDSASGVLNDTPYSYGTRFEDQKGTNPEELLAAAHAGCFTMAVAGEITKKGLKPETLETEATVSMENLRVTGVHLAITGAVPGMNFGEFEDITKDMAKNCVISKALGVPISSEACYKV